MLAGKGLVPAGSVWAKRGKVKPIADRQHEVSVYKYILHHLDEGAAVWCHAWRRVEFRC